MATGQAKHGAFQESTVVPAARVAKLPDRLWYIEGSVLSLAVSTAAEALYGAREDGFLGIPYPSASQQEQSDSIVIAYGASSSTGAAAAQLAAASGVRVIVIVSAKNFDFCHNAGASEVFDYNDSHVVSKTGEAVQKSGLEFTGVMDSIALAEQSFDMTIPIVQVLCGGNIAAVLPGPAGASGVKIEGIFAQRPVPGLLWRGFVASALEKGILRCLPPAQVVGKGLEAIPTGLAASKTGVGAVKVVVDLA